jgi:acyl dehydratase
VPAFEDIEVGHVPQPHRPDADQTDNTWFTLPTCNTNQSHFNAEYASRTEFGQMLVNSCLTLSIVAG